MKLLGQVFPDSRIIRVHFEQTCERWRSVELCDVVHEGRAMIHAKDSIMQVCIHRGTKEIGGTCVEIESQDKRLVLDVGLPLDAPDADTFPLHPGRLRHNG